MTNIINSCKADALPAELSFHAVVLLGRSLKRKESILDKSRFVNKKFPTWPIYFFRYLYLYIKVRNYRVFRRFEQSDITPNGYSDLSFFCSPFFSSILEFSAAPDSDPAVFLKPGLGIKAQSSVNGYFLGIE